MKQAIAIKKNILPLLFVLISFTSFSQVKMQVKITGKITNNTFTSATLYNVGKEIAEVKKAEVSPDGTFSLQHDLTIADFYKLEFDKNNFIMMILKPGEVIEITTDASDFLKKLKVTGSKETMQVFANQRIIDETKFKLDSIGNLANQIAPNANKDSLMRIYQTEYEKTEKSKTVRLTEFMLKNPNSLAILFLLGDIPVEENAAIYKKVDSALFKSYPNNYYVNDLHIKVTSAGKLQIGSEAPDFTLPDTNGVNMSLSSLKGKYVLIDFWAAWCGPCMREMPNVKKLYADFKDKGFEILGVSLDKTKPAWTNAIKNNNLTWKHISDIKFWQSIVVPMYNISGIPYTVLLDKEGKIVAKNLRGEELYKKVESLLR